MRVRDLVPWKENRLSTRDTDDSLYSWRRDFERVFDEFSRLTSLPFGDDSDGFTPLVNVTENEKDIEISAELPGLDEDDIEITLTQDMLTIRGEKKQESEKRKGNYYWMERKYGSFYRSIDLPTHVVDTDNVDAQFKNGVLTIHLPKSKEGMEAAKRIEVKTG